MSTPYANCKNAYANDKNAYAILQAPCASYPICLCKPVQASMQGILGYELIRFGGLGTISIGEIESQLSQPYQQHPIH
jgi:hypothetical protein